MQCVKFVNFAKIKFIKERDFSISEVDGEIKAASLIIFAIFRQHNFSDSNFIEMLLNWCFLIQRFCLMILKIQKHFLFFFVVVFVTDHSSFFMLWILRNLIPLPFSRSGWFSFFLINIFNVWNSVFSSIRSMIGGSVHIHYFSTLVDQKIIFSIALTF